LWNGAVGSLLGGVAERLVRDIVVRHAAVLQVSSLAGAAGDGLVGRIGIVVWLGVFEDDVACVDQARDVAEQTKSDVDDGISSAETSFDPDCLCMVSYIILAAMRRRSD
jgi:hypothetical protein